MSNEEFERKMDFIVEQQAQFASDIQLLRESQVQTEQVVARLAFVTLEGFKNVNTKIDALVDSQIKLTEAQAQSNEDLNAKFSALADSQIKLSESSARTDEKLGISSTRSIVILAKAVMDGNR